MKLSVLIVAKVGTVERIAAELTEKVVGEITVVAGIYDLLLTIETDDPEHYREIILDIIHPIEGVEDTITLLHLT